MRKTAEKQKPRKKLKDLPARPSTGKARDEVKAGFTPSTTRFDPYKNFKF